MSISRARKRSLSPDIHDQRPMKRSQLQRRTVKSKSSKQNELYDAPKLKGMSPAAMREMLLRRVQRFSPELSEVELADQVIPEITLVDTSSVELERETAHVSLFLKTCVGKEGPLQAVPPVAGQPHTLVLTASGIRAADLVRALREIKPRNGVIAKLFAKHIKLKEAIEMCQISCFGIAVGTPQRVLDLMQQDALKTDKLDRIVLDISYIDQKKRGMLDYKEIQTPLLELLRSIRNHKQLQAAEGGKGLIMF